MASLSSPADLSTESRSTAEPNIQKAFSCVLCAQRKVKCDKLPGGCANCTKARVPCIYKAPPPPRRRKKGIRDVDTTVKLRLYEEALRQLGVDPEELVNFQFSKATKNGGSDGLSGINGVLDKHSAGIHRKTYHASEVGVLVSEEGKSRYLENGLWTSLRNEFRESKDILDDSSEEDDDTPNENNDDLMETRFPNGADLLFGIPSCMVPLRLLHPSAVQIFQLWQLYLENINPLVKVFHVPTVQQIISDVSGHLDDIPRNTEALLFAIYCVTITSLGDHDCINLLGESKLRVVQRLRVGAQHALVNASLLKTSDIIVLQAFILYILSLQDYDARIIWHLSGIAQRIGQRIGLHRDGAKLGLSPFDTEIRRRIWWQIIMLEGYAQKLAGTGTVELLLMGDVQMPLNVNDSDLYQDMKSVPKEHMGATDSMFFLIRCHVSEFLKRSTDTHTHFDGVWNKLSDGGIQVSVKDKAIDELEELFQRKFLRFCDPSIPSHFMCTQLSKVIIFMMRFMARSAESQAMTMTQSEKDNLFDLALEIISSQNLVYTMKEMQGFIWHVNLHFQWKAFIYLLSELRYRTEGANVDLAWTEIEKAYNFHPSFDKELSRRALPIAVSSLTLKVWEGYVVARGKALEPEPYFIQLIRSRQVPGKRSKTSSQPSNDSSSHQADDIPDFNRSFNNDNPENMDPLANFDWGTTGVSVDSAMAIGTSDNLLLDYTEKDWSVWKNLLVDFATHDDNDLSTEITTFDLGLQ